MSQLNKLSDIDSTILAHDFIGSPSPETEIGKSLYDDGYALIGNFNLNIDVLSDYINKHIFPSESSKGTDEAVITNINQLPLNISYLEETIFPWVHDYLGDDYEFSGYNVIKLTKHLKSKDQYVSGNWHHDRCGKRVKVFILLSDVTE